MAKIAINGMGRIGRATLKITLDTPDLDVVAVNDLLPVEDIAYLLRFDSVYGRYQKEVRVEGRDLYVGGKQVRFFSEKNPEELPWGDLGVDMVLECTGKLVKKDDLEKHLKAGARMAVLSAPSKSDDVPTVVYGVNDPEGRLRVFSCASCTTNAIAPVMEIMDRRVGVEKAIMTTVHAYTSSQSLVDGPNKKRRRGRAAGVNMVPSSTGAAIATTKALPQLTGRFDGVAIRVPLPTGSLADITFLAKRQVTVDEINKIFREESGSERYKGVLGVNDEDIVSSDIVMDPRASIMDATLTQVVDGNLVKVMAWYDNEWGYASQMVREVREIASQQF